MNTAPVVEEHHGVLVVRDDLFPGGTKARFIPKLFDHANEVAYASSAEGGAQCALAYVARDMGKQATIFTSERADPHPRQFEATRLGANVVSVKPGYLNVVQARARQYCRASGATLAPFGMRVPGCIDVIADAARQIGCTPRQVWCAAGSGTLATALRRAWPYAEHHVVQVGHTVINADVAGAVVHVYPRKYSWAVTMTTPFPCDPHYEAKAWEICQAKRACSGLVIFWNVMGPALAVGAGDLDLHIDWPATILRAEGVVDRLKKYYGSEWTAADQEAADSMLKHLRAHGPEDDEDGLDATHHFMDHYNQSWDWVFRGDPVSMVVDAAACSPRGEAEWHAKWNEAQS
jgi:pyridoxal-phosphate dependent enzyme